MRRSEARSSRLATTYCSSIAITSAASTRIRYPAHLAEALQPVGDALTLLRRLHQRRNSRPVADTLADLLEATRAHVAFALRPGGEQALANVLHIADLGRRYEAGDGLSFRGFVNALGEAADRAEAPEAPILEDGSDGVRMMTVHKAKGLEFPVVVLVDPTCRLSRDTADRHLDASRDLCAVRLAGWAPADLLDHEPLEVDRDRHEGHRLAYVAATRARDLLVVPAVGDAPFTDGWLSPLNDAIYPPIAERRDSAPAPLSPAFRRDSVLERPGGDPARADTVEPGLHRLGEGRVDPYDVVWWDPGVLALDQRAAMGVRHEDLIGKGATRAIVDETLQAYRTWDTTRAESIARASAPSAVVRTASEWAGSDNPLTGDVPEVRVETLGRPDEPRPSGTRFGALVHAVLAGVALDADEGAVARVALAHARLLGASSEEADAASAAAVRVLAHPMVRRAAAAAVCRREWPLTLREEDGSTVEGIADLVFDDDGRWVVVEFKTDVEIGRLGLERYRRQVAFYAAVMARATGRDATGGPLRISIVRRSTCTWHTQHAHIGKAT